MTFAREKSIMNALLGRIRAGILIIMEETAMRGTKLCLGLSETYRLPYDQQVRTLRKIGFEGFFSGWQ